MRMTLFANKKSGHYPKHRTPKQALACIVYKQDVSTLIEKVVFPMKG